MRRQGARVSSAQNVCIFCARHVQRRNLHDTRRAAQNGPASSDQKPPGTLEEERERFLKMFGPKKPSRQAAPQPQSQLRPSFRRNTTQPSTLETEEAQALQRAFGVAPQAKPAKKPSFRRTQTDQLEGGSSWRNRDFGLPGRQLALDGQRSSNIGDVSKAQDDSGFDPAISSRWSHLKRNESQATSSSGADRQQVGANGQFVAFNPEIHGREGFRSVFRPSNDQPGASPKGDGASPKDESSIESEYESLKAEQEKEEESSISAQQALLNNALKKSKKFGMPTEAEASNQKGKKGKSSRRRGDDEEEDDYARVRAERKARKKAEREAQKAATPTPIAIPEYISVSNLAGLMRMRTEHLVRKMEDLGFEDIQPDDVLNEENAGLIAMELNFEPVAASPEDDVDLHPAPEPEDKSALPQRPPIVTIMGHVDHGKTTLLDYLRKSSVVATEFGGITQHIGAFSVPLSSGKAITFLDTPGHAAFLNMRQRGANVTDIVVLVVAADDSVKPQTLEAIKHAKGARVPIIVAINKVDKEGANPDRVKQDLARHGIDVEEYGGDIQAINVSGKTGHGVDELEEAIGTLSEVLDYRADPTGPVEARIIEASTKKSGRTATLLIKRGTLRVGDIIVAGTTFARVRTMRNEGGELIEEVTPGMPVVVDGWRGVPVAGDEVLQAPSEQRATEVIEYRERKEESEQLAKDMEAIAQARKLESTRREEEKAAAVAAKEAEVAGEAAVEAEAEAKDEGPPSLIQVPFILKADVSGSAEAVMDYVMTVGNSEVRPTILRSEFGSVSEFDVEHAAVAGGHILSFNVPLDPRIASLAEQRGVRVLEDNVIYRLVDAVKALLSERLPPNMVQRVVGEAQVLQTFSISVGGRKKLLIAGCRVSNGVVGRGNRVRVLRGEKKVYDGTVTSLKNVKKDVSEMRKGTECGMAFDAWEDFKANDTIQCYEERAEKRFL